MHDRPKDAVVPAPGNHNGNDGAQANTGKDIYGLPVKGIAWCRGNTGGEKGYEEKEYEGYVFVHFVL
jgi:hypothetical protein